MKTAQQITGIHLQTTENIDQKNLPCQGKKLYQGCFPHIYYLIVFHLMSSTGAAAPTQAGSGRGFSWDCDPAKLYVLTSALAVWTSEVILPSDDITCTSNCKYCSYIVHKTAYIDRYIDLSTWENLHVAEVTWHLYTSHKNNHIKYIHINIYIL